MAGRKMSDKKPRLRFERQPNEQGRLARVCQGARGYQLWYGDLCIGSADALYGNWPQREITGYYWGCATIAALGIEMRNTAYEPVATMEEAKDQLRAYVEDCLKRAGLR